MATFCEPDPSHCTAGNSFGFRFDPSGRHLLAHVQLMGEQVSTHWLHDRSAGKLLTFWRCSAVDTNSSRDSLLQGCSGPGNDAGGIVFALRCPGLNRGASGMIELVLNKGATRGHPQHGNNFTFSDLASGAAAASFPGFYSRT
jgi:hypothetical protein